MPVRSTQHLYIYGCNIEALSSAVVMASFGHKVSWHVSKDSLNALLTHVHFEHQLIALWQLYIQQERIHVLSEHVDQQPDQYNWVFVNGLDEPAEQIVQNFTDACTLILSGSMQQGKLDALAKTAKTERVFYIPFVFLRDGASFSSMLSPSLLLIGEKTLNTYQSLGFISPLIKHAGKVAVSSIKNTEFARSSIMAMLASRLSFMNEMSRLADSLDVDMNVVKHMMGLDSRIGPTYLNPSWGFGGFTLPNELKLLQHSFENQNISTDLVRAITAINEDQKELIFRKFWQYFDSYIQGKKVVVWGAGYKAGSGRTLNSAIHPLLALLWNYDVETYVYDTHAAIELTEYYPEKIQTVCHLVDDAYSKLSEVDAVFIINWPDVAQVDITALANANVPVFDGQNLLTNGQIQQLNNHYVGIGRQKS